MIFAHEIFTAAATVLLRLKKTAFAMTSFVPKSHPKIKNTKSKTLRFFTMDSVCYRMLPMPRTKAPTYHEIYIPNDSSGF